MTDLLTIRKLVKSYHDCARELKVLQGVDLDLKTGEALAIVGMSGAGKSTFLHLLGGLDKPDAGTIRFRGEDITGWPKPRMNEFRNKSIGFVFQFHHLLPEFSALENVMMPALVARESRHAAQQAARALLEEMGLGERLTHRPAKLSGGEQQRVALARALINAPQLLLADEPTGNLDPRTGERIIETIWNATVKKDRSLVIVTHEPSIAQRADKIFFLSNGRLSPLKHDDVHAQMKQMQAKG
ncbi:ABC transporter ATP-binding protein [Candidatus Sumerlaeota bacterium]|nr:ABC transporter ATP-binding protein [Candidatus Sumerlaeota bacterium]